MLSAVSITLCGAIGVRLQQEMGVSLRGLMEAAMVLVTCPSVRPETPCYEESRQDDLSVLRGEPVTSSSQIFGTEGKYRFSHNILGWLNSDRDNWSGETRILISSLI